MCDALLASLDFVPCKKVGVAIGGTHYPTKFNKLLLDSEFGLAAVASKHALAAIDEDMLAQMLQKSTEKVTHIILDSKGLGSHKDRITKLAEKTGLEVLKV
jgi:D-aminoacyl-tRNA deacylase